MSSGYEQIYESLIPRLKGCDLPEAAGRLGLQLQTDGSFYIRFLGREYEIGPLGVHPTDGHPVNVNIRSVLAYYTLSKGAGEPAYSYVPISVLTGSGLRFSSNIEWMSDRLGKAFSGDYALFCDCLHRLGGVFEGKQNGGYKWSLFVLPKIPLEIVYFEADDEFPCEVKMMFDANASRFLEFECVAFLQGCLVRALLQAAGAGVTTD